MVSTAQRIARYSLYIGGLGALAYFAYLRSAERLSFSIKNIQIINPANMYMKITVAVKNPSGLKFPLPKMKVDFLTGGKYIGTAESTVWQLIEGRSENLIELYGYFNLDNFANAAVSLAMSAQLPAAIDYNATLYINKIQIPIQGTYIL